MPASVIFRMITLIVLSATISLYSSYLDLNGMLGATQTDVSTPIKRLAKTTATDPVDSINSLRMLTELNTSSSADAYPFFCNNGLSVYFTKSGSHYFATRSSTTSTFGTPAPVPGLSAYTDVMGCWVAPDELTIYFTNRSGNCSLYYATRTAKTLPFSNIQAVTLSGFSATFFSDPSFTPDMSEMFLYDGSGITHFTRNSATGYTSSGSVTSFVKSGYSTYSSPGQVSQNGLHFYISLQNSATNLRSIFRFTRSSISSPWDTGVLLIPTSTTFSDLYQPSASPDESQIIMVTGGSWTGNDLVIGNLKPTLAPTLIPVVSPSYNRKPLLQWHKLEGASIYSLEISDSSALFSGTSLILAIPTADTFFSPTVDLPCSKLFWRVKGDNSDYASSSFTILDNRVPHLIPYLPKETLERRPTLSWNRVIGASSYSVSIYADTGLNFFQEDFDSASLSGEWTLTGTPTWYLTSSDKYSGFYSLRSGLIGASQSCEISTSKTCIAGTISFSKKVSSESYDRLTFFIDNDSLCSWSGTSDVTWSTVSFPVTAGQHTFRWKYSKDGSVNSGLDAAMIDQITFPVSGQTLFIAVPVVDTFYSVSANLPLGKITWQVASNLITTPSLPDTFRVISDTIPFLYRWNGQTVTTVQPMFRWHPVPEAEFYSLSLYSTKDPTTAYLAIPTSDTFYTPSLNLPQGTYFWTVSSSRNGIRALPDTLTISCVNNESIDSADDSVITLAPNTPNPFNPSTQLRFSVPKSAKTLPVNLTIYGSDGTTIRTLIHSPMAAGHYSVQFHAIDNKGHQLPSGIYITRLTIGNESLTRTMILLK